ncbi:MAG: hypothetical protein PHR13_12195 [Dysgonamonadaceae bacterium]|nr:hypothetical protein [Dysgonamonadaceae bacterium]
MKRAYACYTCTYAILPEGYWWNPAHMVTCTKTRTPTIIPAKKKCQKYTIVQ